MDIVFIDTANWAFDPDTPYERPLGGSQSAAAYLTPELAKLGHHVTLASPGARHALVRGVHCAPTSRMYAEALRAANCVVHVEAFAARALELLAARQEHPADTEARLQAQVA